MNNYGNGSITARGDAWQICIEAGRDPQTGHRRRRRSTVHGTRRDAQKKLREELQKRDQGRVRPSGKITVGDWLLDWLINHQSEGHIGPRVHERYHGIISKHINPLLGSVPLRDLRPAHIKDAKARWLSGVDSTADAPLSGASVSKHMLVLRQALSQAVRDEHIDRNPAAGVASPSAKPESERRALTEEEITLLVSRSLGTRWDAPIRFTLASGARQGETLGLAWAAVSLEEGTVDIRRTLSCVGGKVAFLPPKTDNARRTIELSVATIRMLELHRVAQNTHRLKLGPVWQDNDLVFPSLIGTPWSVRPFYKGYRRIVDESGIEHPETVNWHSLRHTAASQWLRHGIDVFTASRRLGHAKASFTMDCYGHLMKGQQRAAAEALDYLLAQG
jgi:integrase